MEAFLAPSRPVNQFFGVYPAIVIDNQDPEGRYRVKVKFPWMMESDSRYVNVADKEEMPSTWCRISSGLAGTNAHGGGNTDEHRGAFFLPEVDDEVLVTFMFGAEHEGHQDLIIDLGQKKGPTVLVRVAAAVGVGARKPRGDPAPGGGHLLLVRHIHVAAVRLHHPGKLHLDAVTPLRILVVDHDRWVDPKELVDRPGGGKESFHTRLLKRVA